MSNVSSKYQVSDDLVLRFKELVTASHFTELEKVYEANHDVYTVPNSEKEGHSPIYRNRMTGEKKDISAYFDEEMDNFYTLFELACKLFPDKNCLGRKLFNNTKPSDYDDFYTFQTYSTIRQRKNYFGAGLVQVVTNHKLYSSQVLNNLPEFDLYNNDKPYRFVVALFSGNRLEWSLTDLACQAYNLVNTALYDTLGPHSAAYILELTKAPVVVSSRDKIMKLLELKRSKPEELSTLLVIISMDKLDIQKDYPLFKLAEDVDINLYDFEQVELLGQNFPVPLCPVQRNDLYTISFTSGTTGMPKGVVIPQRMLVAGMKYCFRFVGKVIEYSTLEGEIRHLSFLPLTHIYERESFAFSIITGVTIGFPQTSVPVATLLSDLKALKPHSFTAVPRVFTKLEALLKEGIDQAGVKGLIMKKAIDQRMKKHSERNLEKGEMYLYDKIFTLKLRQLIGFDNVTSITTGSAPISVETIRFLKAALNIGASQGWGMTETFAGVNSAFPFEKDPGSSGVVGNTTEVRLRDLPSMNYVHDDPDGIPKGELLVRGPQVFDYYFKRPEETEKSFDDEGFFHTGDIAKIDAQGRLYIIDRVKNFFKLAQGEYITPEKIENTYLSNCPLLTQIFVYGDSFKSFLVAIVGFDPVMLKSFFRKHSKDLPKESRSELLKICHKNTEPNEDHPELFEYINNNAAVKRFLVLRLNVMVNASKKEGDQNILQGFEKIHNLKLDYMPLKLEDDVITPTFKLKRAVAGKWFEAELKELYEEGSLINGSKI